MLTKNECSPLMLIGHVRQILLSKKDRPNKKKRNPKVAFLCPN